MKFRDHCVLIVRAEDTYSVRYVPAESQLFTLLEYAYILMSSLNGFLVRASMFEVSSDVDLAVFQRSSQILVGTVYGYHQKDVLFFSKILLCDGFSYSQSYDRKKSCLPMQPLRSRRSVFRIVVIACCF